MRTPLASKLSTGPGAHSIKSAVRWLVVFALCVSAGACTASAGTPAPSTPTHVETSDGRFHLTFEMPKATWRTTEALEGNATLSLSDSGSATISGSELIVFGFAEVGGDRHMGPLWSLVCTGSRLDAGHPVTSSLIKSGSWSETGPDASFNTSFFTDPLVHLTPGDWTITAVAPFTDGADCAGPEHTLSVSIGVHTTP